MINFVEVAARDTRTWRNLHLKSRDEWLLTIIEKFAGGPVGVDSLAAALSEERGTIEDVLEPFLIQQGFMMRTARGRVATKNAYLHFGLEAPKAATTQDSLFDNE